MTLPYHSKDLEIENPFTRVTYWPPSRLTPQDSTKPQTVTLCRKAILRRNARALREDFLCGWLHLDSTLAHCVFIEKRQSGKALFSGSWVPWIKFRVSSHRSDATMIPSGGAPLMQSNWFWPRCSNGRSGGKTGANSLLPTSESPSVNLSAAAGRPLCLLPLVRILDLQSVWEKAL